MGSSHSLPPTMVEAAARSRRPEIVDCRAGGDLVFVTWAPPPRGHSPTLTEVYGACVEQLDAHGAEVLHERVFCRLGSAGTVIAARASTAAARWPVRPTVVEGESPLASDPAGLQLVGCRSAGGRTTPVVSTHGSAVGVEITGSLARYLALSDVASALPRSLPKPEMEAEAAIVEAARLMADHGWSPHHIRRTWFYLDDILTWYSAFNSARDRAFSTLGLDTADPTAFLPASTGIAGRGRGGRRCTLDLLAIQGLPKKPFSVRRLKNPLQNEAPEYGSAFSRGLEVTTGGARIGLVSGTAAIDGEGRSVAAGDVEGQVACTLDTVEALLADAGMTAADIVQGTAFLKHPEDHPDLLRELDRRGLARLPVVIVVADVCRDELLFELDATAVAAVGE